MTFSSEKATQETEKQLEHGKEIAKESAKDWFNYIQEHPIQSMFFGVVAYFAVKGCLGRN